MPNRVGLTRGGPREAACLEALRGGATRAAAAAAAGVGRRTLFRHLERSAPFRADVEQAEALAEHRMIEVVVEAALRDRDPKMALAWLERRRSSEWRPVQGIDARIDAHHDVDLDVVALAQRYTGLSAAETEAEIRRLAWVDAPADDTGEGRAAVGDGGAILALPAATRDEAANVSPARAESTEAPEPQANGRHGPPQPAGAQPPLEIAPAAPMARCRHCRGQVPGHHEDGCPVFLPDGRLRVPWAAMGGDPR